MRDLWVTAITVAVFAAIAFAFGLSAATWFGLGAITMALLAMWEAGAAKVHQPTDKPENHTQGEG